MAERDSSGRRGERAFDKGGRETVQKMHDEQARVCFLVQEQSDRGAQAVDGHSPNSIILLVAKFKTGRLDCERYKDFIFILSLWGRKFAYKSVYRSVCKTINHSKPGLIDTEPGHTRKNLCLTPANIYWNQQDNFHYRLCVQVYTHTGHLEEM